MSPWGGKSWAPFSLLRRWAGGFPVVLAKRARVAVQGRVALQPTQPAFFLPAAVFVFAALFSIASAPTAPRRRVDEPVAPLRDIEKGPGTGKKEGKGLTLYT